MASRRYRIPMGAHSAGYRIADSRMLALRPTIEKWIENINTYSIKMRQSVDQIYWYNERATLSSLAGAFWQTGWIAVEEFAWNKKRKEGGYSVGRVDLWVTKGNRIGSKASLYWYFEAKQSWVNGEPRRSAWKEKIRRHMAEAAKDSRAANAYETGRRAGIVFVIPVAKRAELTGKIRNHEIMASFETCLEFCLANKNRLKWDLCAWCAPKYGENSEEEGKFYPGVVLMVRRA